MMVSCTYPEPEGFNVTFSINTANIIVGPNGMYIGGGMFGDALALPLSVMMAMAFGLA